MVQLSAWKVELMVGLSVGRLVCRQPASFDGWLVQPMSARMVRLVVGVVCLDGQGGGDAIQLDGWLSCQLGQLAGGRTGCVVASWWRGCRLKWLAGDEALYFAGWLVIGLCAWMVG